MKEELEAAQLETLYHILSTEANPINEQNILASPGLWKYKRPLTIAQLLTKLNSVGQVILLQSKQYN